MILLDTSADSASRQPENAIVIPPWTGSREDAGGLVNLIPFLECMSSMGSKLTEAIAMFSPNDVRPVIQRYEGKDIPTEFAKMEAEMKRKVVEDWEAKRGGSSPGGWFSSPFKTVQVGCDMGSRGPADAVERRIGSTVDVY